MRTVRSCLTTISRSLLLWVVGSWALTAVGKPIAAERHAETQDAATPIRAVRVLLGSKVSELRVRADGGVAVSDGADRAIGTVFGDDWIIVKSQSDTAFLVADGIVRDDICHLRPVQGGSLRLSIRRDGQWLDEIDYPGSLRLSIRSQNAIDVINFVDVERYVACVVAKEAWPTFATEAFRAQAIVSRGYVLFQMRRRKTADYDVRATQGSQVYAGIRNDGTGKKAADAARYTRGLVCTWHDGTADVLFSSYYSAACGGMSQSAAIFGKADDIPPLAGGVPCDYCKIAPGETYRWGPVRIERRRVFDRLVSRYPKMSSLRGLRNIEVIERSPHGRSTRIRIIGDSGETHEISAENFRFAAGANEVRSTDCDIRMTERDVIFENGRGYGHGLGLCQWGAQGQALTGKSAAEILRYYYPGAKLTRVY